MDIELRNIHVNERLSEASYNFSATIYINGVRAGEATNRGRGEQTDYYGFDTRGNFLIEEAERYCETLPPKVYPGMGDLGKDLTVSMNFENYIDHLVYEFQKPKYQAAYQKKVERAMQNNIVVGNDTSFRSWDLKVPVTYFLTTEKRRAALKEFFEVKGIPALKEDEMILNTNLGDDFVKSLSFGQEKIVSQRPAVKDNKEEPEQDLGAKRRSKRQ